jgi:hypothetical protein
MLKANCVMRESGFWLLRRESNARSTRESDFIEWFIGLHRNFLLII